jgi:hypothetical protein
MPMTARGRTPFSVAAMTKSTNSDANTDGRELGADGRLASDFGLIGLDGLTPTARGRFFPLYRTLSDTVVRNGHARIRASSRHRPTMRRQSTQE